MGTSTGYQMPTGGDWKPLKTDATRFVQADVDGRVTPHDLLSQYVQAMQSTLPARTSSSGSTDGGIGGGAGSGNGGGSGGGRNTNSISTRAAQRVGQGIGNFLSRVGSSGLGDALREIGLGDLVGKSIPQIAAALLDALAGPSSTIDDHAARCACDDLNKELLCEARTPEDVEKVLKTALDAIGLGGLLMRFFSLYIYRRFCRDFYENWMKRVGPSKANAKMAAIKKYIDTVFKARCVNKDVTALNWRGGEGGRLVTSVLTQTCRVFEVGA